MRLGLTTRVALGFGAALFMLGMVSVVSYWNIRNYLQDAQWLARTLEITSELHRLDSQMAQAKAQERGYVIAPNDRFFNNYEAARIGADRSYARLRQLTAGNNEQNRKLNDLELKITSSFAFYNEVMLQARQGDINKARTIVGGT